MRPLAGLPAPPGRDVGQFETLAEQLPPGFSIEWTGQSLQEKLSGSEAPVLLALSMLVVFLVLARKEFWDARDQWYPTWEKNGQMVVKSVKMFQQKGYNGCK